MNKIELDIEKVNYKDFVIKKSEKIEYKNIENNIRQSWCFLQLTHKLDKGECLCIRALPTKTNKWDKWCIPSELVIYGYTQEEYMKYYKFLKGKINGKRIYNFYYNIYNINIEHAKEIWQEKGGFLGKTCNVSSTNIIMADFDDFTLEDYYRLKEDFKNKGLDGTVDVMSGHGFHIIFRLKERSYDEQLLLKFIKVLQENGYNPDVACQDAARIMRLPFFYNQKPLKYNVATLSEVTDGIVYKSKTFTVEEIFEKLGFDYNNFSLEDYYKERKKVNRQKREIIKNEILFNKEVDLIKEYNNVNLNLLELPEGILNMLKGFRKGYSNLQTMVLTLYFKRKGILLEDIQKILNIVKNINGNTWNTWDVEDEVERFYINYNYINKFLLMDMEDTFGTIKMEYENNLCRIPIGLLKPSELKLYLYLLINKDVKKVDIINNLNFSNNKIDRIVKENSLFIVENRRYKINTDVKFDNYLLCNKDYIYKLLKLEDNQISVYSYLYFKQNIKKEIQISHLSISNGTLISESTIKTTIKELQKKELLQVQTFKWNKELQKKESNIYKLRVI